MIIFLLSLLVFIQAATFLLLYKVYKRKYKIALEKQKELPIENINYLPVSVLVKQTIELNDYTISFRTSFDGYLYVTAKYANVYYDNKKATEVTKHLEKYFIKKDSDVRIENIRQLKSIRFIKWSNDDFIADINKGIFKNT